MRRYNFHLNAVFVTLKGVVKNQVLQPKIVLILTKSIVAHVVEK